MRGGSFPKALKNKVGEDLLKRLYPNKPKMVHKPMLRKEAVAPKHAARIRYEHRVQGLEPELDYTMTVEEALEAAGL